ncbi:MAG: hypothetical protein B7X95_08500 [Methylophilaceae bacterium 17-44-8]|jgi:hypothetical protein|nr:MAG: hypothetical protein B7Y48_06570 [Methylophilales bacterium 28-44-11]OZA04903.1 MAG: hypothetical protein B7X95_08500 [Methylophilaceae bacterium 17-44-8]
MTMQLAGTQNKNIWLWLILTITVALTAWTAFQPDEESTATDLVVSTNNQRTTNIVKNTLRLSSASPLQSVTQQGAWEISHREPLTDKPTNLFPVHSWAVIAPTQKTKPAPPPPPVAPPAPFTYMGKLEDGPKGTLIFLMANNKVYSVAKGEQVDAFWRLEGEDANQLMFTFLPLNLPQTLSKTQPLISPDLPNAADSAIN